MYSYRKFQLSKACKKGTPPLTVFVTVVFKIKKFTENSGVAL